jgi:hypothetical protein
MYGRDSVGGSLFLRAIATNLTIDRIVRRDEGAGCGDRMAGKLPIRISTKEFRERAEVGRGRIASRLAAQKSS